MKSITAAELITIMGDRWVPKYRRPSGAEVYPPVRYVYVAKTDSGFYKVGITKSVVWRLYDLSRQFGERQTDYSREHYWGPKTSRLIRDICFSRKP